jgi:uncharacterized protein YcbK (DUF882 family)
MSSRRSRRIFLQEFLAGCCAASLPAWATGTEERRLLLQNTHTGDVLDTIYWTNGQAQPGELGRLDWIFRDHRAGSVLPIDARLFDLLHELAASAGVEPRYEIISGYRSPATNAMLVATSDSVSSSSLHMEGKAVDVRLVGLPLSEFRDLALARRMGGVGYYPGSDFVHLDVGRVRSW